MFSLHVCSTPYTSRCAGYRTDLDEARETAICLANLEQCPVEIQGAGRIIEVIQPETKSDQAI